MSICIQIYINRRPPGAPLYKYYYSRTLLRRQAAPSSDARKDLESVTVENMG